MDLYSARWHSGGKGKQGVRRNGVGGTLNPRQKSIIVGLLRDTVENGFSWNGVAKKLSSAEFGKKISTGGIRCFFDTYPNGVAGFLQEQGVPEADATLILKAYEKRKKKK